MRFPFFHCTFSTQSFWVSVRPRSLFRAYERHFVPLPGVCCLKSRGKETFTLALLRDIDEFLRFLLHYANLGIWKPSASGACSPSGLPEG